MPSEIYVSITGLKLRGFWHVPSFWFHAVRSMAQARRAPGNLLAEARTIDGVHHTLTVWTDRDAMRAFLVAGAHRKAMRRFPAIATGKVIGYHTDAAPDWAEARAIWADRGRTV